MAEEGETPTPVVHPGLSKAEVEERLRLHKEEINNLFESHKNSIMEEIRSLGAGQQAEKDQLLAQVQDLSEWKKEQLKAADEREKVKGDEHTIVTPPANIPPPQVPTPSGQPGQVDSGPTGRRGFHRFW